MPLSLQENVGATDAMEPIPVGEGIRPIPVPALPPYNGFGSFEDSEQSCKNLVSPAPLPPAALACLSMHLTLIAGLQLPLPACLSVCPSVTTLAQFNTATSVLMTSTQLPSVTCNQTEHHMTFFINIWSSCRTDRLPHGIHALLSLRITGLKLGLDHLTHNQKGLLLFAPKLTGHEIEVYQRLLCLRCLSCRRRTSTS